MTEIPSGTITFLFTDIEGSTKLWETHTEDMNIALARHDDILRNKIDANDGYVFKTVGDAFCAAFSTASQAVRAALEGQKALESENWTVPGGIRVRMALHTGEARERDKDYFGPAVNRVARLLSAAHGGQILLTLAATELVKGELPEETSLLSLGLHRLKDLSRPQQVLQLAYLNQSED